MHDDVLTAVIEEYDGISSTLVSLVDVFGFLWSLTAFDLS